MPQSAGQAMGPDGKGFNSHSARALSWTAFAYDHDARGERESGVVRWERVMALYDKPMHTSSYPTEGRHVRWLLRVPQLRREMTGLRAGRIVERVAPIES